MEYVNPVEAKYAYSASVIFEEILEFYAYLNAWAIKPIENKDHPEMFCYDNE